MSVLTIDHPFDRLQRLYHNGFEDQFLEAALSKILEHQRVRDEEALTRVNRELALFEQEHGLTSDEFWQRFQTGQMPDTADFMEWNVFCKMKQRLIGRLTILRNGQQYERN
jgi:hypothetical protein